MRGSRPPSLTINNLFSAGNGISAGSEKIGEVPRTVDSEIAQGCTRSALDLCVMASEEEEDGIEGVSSDLADFFLCDFGESECCAALKVDVVAEREGCESL
jgi:hypothetical protein